jgi:hypothetical protein
VFTLGPMAQATLVCMKECISQVRTNLESHVQNRIGQMQMMWYLCVKISCCLVHFCPTLMK